MKKRLREWLYRRFLPNMAREQLLAENRQLQTRLLEAQAEIAKLTAYIDGLERGMRAQRSRVIVNNTGGSGK